MKEKFVMKPYVWYSRPEGNSREHTQYGLVTNSPEVHFSIYFAPTPWGDKNNDSISFAHFDDDLISYVSKLDDFEPSGMDGYLWYKLSHSRKIAHQAIAKALNEESVHLR